MKLELDAVEPLTAYAVLDDGELLTEKRVAEALEFARRHKRPLVEVYQGEQLKRLMVASEVKNV